MSLINDALKRAKENHQGQPSQAALGSPMEPVQAAPRSHWPLILGGLLCVAFIAAGLIFWNMAHSAQTPRKTQTIARTSTSPSAAAAAAATMRPRTNGVVAAVPARTIPPVAKVAVAPVPTNPLVSTAPKVVVTPPSAAKVTVTSAPPKVVLPAPGPAQPSPKPAVVTEVKPVPAAPTPAAQVKVPPPVFPELRLTAVYYNTTRPVAVINNASLSLGDEISGARLVKVEPRKVTLKWNNQLKELTLD
jgi:hypothetical protein